MEFHRKLRCDAPGTVDVAALHTSYALLNGYETLLRSVGRPPRRDLEQVKQRLMLAGDTRDVLAACGSLARLLGVPLTESLD